MSSKSKKITVSGVDINIIDLNKEDYICITDMANSRDGNARASDIIKNWLRSRSTIEFLGTWEILNNPNFKVVEFDHFKKSAGLPTFVLSANQWVEKTNAIGIFSKAGKYGGTYAHKDIAFEFGSAISALFKLYLIKEFQRLKDFESKTLNLEWDYKRFLSKVNYTIHTDAVKANIIPLSELPKESQWLEYAKEADILNFAMFGMTAKQWRDKNPEREKHGNIRDYANTHELTVLSNLESYNAQMINDGLNKQQRFLKLRNMAVIQLESLRKNYTVGTIESPYVIEEQFYKEIKKENRSEFDSTLERLMKVPKPEK